jgi:hypothetical protein
MLNLSKPRMSDMTFKRELPNHLSYLSKGKTFISIRCRAGGYINTEWQKLNDEIDTQRQVKTMEVTDHFKDKKKYAQEMSNMSKELGEMRLHSLYDACIISWDTNILNNGKPMQCNRENFMELAQIRIEELVDYFLDFSKYVEEIGNFINKADEVTEKN